jgi:hypothetical protein
MATAQLFLCGLLVSAQVPSLGTNFDQSVLISGESGYVMGDAWFVAGPGKARKILWNPSGTKLAVVLEMKSDEDTVKVFRGDETATRHRLAIYDTKTNQTMTIALGADVMGVEVEGWIPQSNAIVYQVAKVLPSGPQRDKPEPVFQLFRWDSSLNTPQLLGSTKEGAGVSISHKMPYGIVSMPIYGAVGQIENHNHFLILKSGSLSPLRISAPDNMGEIVETQDGSIAFVSYQVSGRGAARKVTTNAFNIAIDGTLTGPIDALKIRAYEEKPPNPNDLQTSLTLTEPKNGPNKTKVQSAWLWKPESGQVRSALIAAEANEALLSPDASAVAYASRGNIFVRKIEKVGSKDLLAAMENMEKNDLMTRGKQVALGIIIYCSDYDDEFPLSSGWHDAVYPYIKSKELMDGFVYEMNGGNAGKIDNPSGKRLGFVEGRFGRAVAYADGHVIWEKRRIP